jgi:uncharacterized protein
LIRVVLDTNIIISALVFGGNPRAVLDLIIRKKISGGLSEALFNELQNVLGRNKFELSSEYVKIATDSLLAVFEQVTPEERVSLISADSDDNRVLECAVEFKADFIVTGDKHLLQIENFRGVKIVTPAGFMEK